MTDMERMFANAYAFNKPIGKWNVGKIETMKTMFGLAEAFNQDIRLWNVINVVNCSDFSSNAALWLLDKPNLTNCTPYRTIIPKYYSLLLLVVIIRAAKWPDTTSMLIYEAFR
ncbi:MAG: BspA family leucine-rich repeat surface protein [Algibacter sp.]